MRLPLWSVAFPFKKSHLSTGTIILSDEVAFTRFRQCNMFLEEATCCNIFLTYSGLSWKQMQYYFRENGWKWYYFQTCWIMKMHFSIEELYQIDKTRAWTTIHRMQYSSTKFAFLFNRCFFKRCTYSFHYVVLVWKKLFLKANTSFQVCILTVLTFQKANTCTHFWKHNIRWREPYVMFTKNVPEQNKSHDSTICNIASNKRVAFK